MLGMRAPFIVISGTIGSGKSTLTTALADALGVPAFVEQVDKNPYFGAPSVNAFQSELWFLNESLVANRHASNSTGGVLDRSPEEHMDVFARLRGNRNWIAESDRALLESAYVTAARAARNPNLLVHLDVAPEVARERIVRRGRPSEIEGVDLAYLRELQSLYESFLRRWSASPILRVYSDRLDFKNDPAALEQVVEDVKVRLGQEIAVVRRTDDLPMPARKLPGDAGIDLAAAENVILRPLQRKTVSTGIRMHIPEGHVGLIVPRSGLARRGITHLDSPGIIDSGYRGEVHFLLYNTNQKKVFRAKAGERLGQIVIVPFNELTPIAVQDLSPSIRDQGKFNSTGR